MTCTPIVHFAIMREIASEMSEPVIPHTRQNIANCWMSIPFAFRYGLTPSRLKRIDIVNITKMLVRMKRNMRFMTLLG
jgi:hypothetical protein